MKKIFFISLLIILVFQISTTVYAQENAFYSDSINEILDQIPKDSKTILDELGLNDYTFDELNNVTIDDIWKMITSVFNGCLKTPTETLILLFGIIIISAVCLCYISNNNMQILFESITVIVISLTVFSVLMSCIERAVTALNSVCTIMKVLVPIISAISSFSGNPALSVSYNAITVYASEILGAVCSDFLTPVLMNFTVLSVCIIFNPAIKGENILSAIKKVINMLLGLCASVFTGISGIKSLLSSGADKISVKGIQFLLGSSVPVVGGALSDGLSSVLATINLMKSSLGVTGIIILLILVLPVICELTLWSFVMSVSSYICNIFSQNKTESVLSSFKFVITMLISIILFCVYIFTVSTGMVILMGSK